MLCEIKYKTFLLTPERGPMTNHDMEATKVLLGEPMNFIGVTYRTMRVYICIYIRNCMSQGLHTVMK